MPDRYECQECKRIVVIGDWPFCPHGRANPHHGFEPYYDEQISTSGEPVWIQTPGDRAKYLRPHWKDDYLVHMQPRDKPDSYYKQLNERRAERAERERKERR